MFTWECPSCGKDLDIDAQSCPKCGEQFGNQETAERIAPISKPPVTPKVASAAPSALPTSAPPPPNPASAPAQFTPALPSAARPAPAAGIHGKHLAVVAIVLLVAIGGAVYMAHPDLFGSAPKLQLEDVPNAEEIGLASAAFGDLQVAGIRPFYTEDLNAKVRAVVINHGETPQLSVRLEAHLSPQDAPLTSPPLASFLIELDEELGPQESRDIETDLMTLGTLASFPPWKELRIELEVR